HVCCSASSVGPAGSWSNNVYQHVVMTDSGGAIKAYLNGALQASTTEAALNIPGGNPLSFFLDDSAAEYSSSRVALIRLFDSPLTPGDVTALYNNGSPVDLQLGAAIAPEPGAMSLFAGALCIVAILRRRPGR